MLSDLLPPADGRAPIYLLAENVRSLFNVGALFRTADGIGAAGVCLTGFTGTPPRKEIARVALGAEETTPWWSCESATDAVRAFQRADVQVVALERNDTSVDYRKFDYRFPVGLVVGHEVEGVARETIDACDGVVRLPMYGAKGSLNVSVAAAVGLYHLRALYDRTGIP